MTNQVPTENVELDGLKRDIELGKYLAELESSEAFDKVIKEAFLKEELEYASRDVISSNEFVAGAGLDRIKAVSYLRRHLEVIKANAEIAKEDIGATYE